MKLGSIIAVGVVGACGASESQRPGGPTTITIVREASTTVDQLAIRDGDEPWEILSLDASEFVVDTERYVLAAACTQNGYGNVLRLSRALASTVDDQTSTHLPCSNFTADEGPRHDVTFVMQEAGQIDFGDNQRESTTGPWTVNASVAPGRHPLVAWDAGRMAIRHDVPIDAPTTLPDVSLAAEGQPFVPTTFSLAGASSFTTLVFLEIDREQAWYHQGRDPTAPLPNPDLLRDTDEVTVYLDASTGFVAIEDFDHTAPTSYELLPALTGASALPRGVAWADALELDMVYVDRVADGGLFQESVLAHVGWLDDPGAVELDFFGTIPEWPAAHRFDGGDLYFEAMRVPDERTTIATTARFPAP